MIHGNVLPLCPLRSFSLIAGLPANWYEKLRTSHLYHTSRYGGTAPPPCPRWQKISVANKQMAEITQPPGWLPGGCAKEGEREGIDYTILLSQSMRYQPGVPF